MAKTTKSTTLIVALAVLALTSGEGQRPVAARPARSATPHLLFPRISGLTDRNAQNSANAVLAKRQREDMITLRFCRRRTIELREKDDDSETTRVTYVSSLLLSVDVRKTLWLCAPYPQLNIPEPITVDLQTGQEVDWSQFFVSGFLPTMDFHINRKPRSEPSSPLTDLYLRKYKNDAECVSAVKDDSSYEFDLWLDRRRAALVLVPDFPHVIRACADEVYIPLSEIVPYVADRDAARELSQIHSIASGPH